MQIKMNLHSEQLKKIRQETMALHRRRIAAIKGLPSIQLAGELRAEIAISDMQKVLKEKALFTIEQKQKGLNVTRAAKEIETIYRLVKAVEEMNMEYRNLIVQLIAEIESLDKQLIRADKIVSWHNDQHDKDLKLFKTALNLLPNDN